MFTSVCADAYAARMYACTHVCMRDICIHARARTHTILGSYMTNHMQQYRRALILCSAPETVHRRRHLST
jgi:hypothetical protein